MHLLPVVVFALCSVVGLLAVPFGLPGLWVITLGVIGYSWLTGFRSAGLGTIAAAVGLALMGDVVEWWLGFRLTRQFGGSRRAAWGALVGGLIGAGIGVPLPFGGSVVGALMGSLVGAALLELAGGGSVDSALRAGWGAFLGRVIATAAKVGLGLAIAVVGLFAILRGS
jgi:uncharacterized protein